MSVLLVDSRTQLATDLVAREDDEVGWVTRFSGRRFAQQERFWEVYTWFPEADLHYCPEIAPDTIERFGAEGRRTFLSGCLWLSTIDLTKLEYLNLLG
jgi:hypothetical protein